MFASIAVALAAQADGFPHPYDHIFGILGIVGTAVNGYLAQRPRDDWSDEKRHAYRELKQLQEKGPEPPQAA